MSIRTGFSFCILIASLLSPPVSAGSLQARGLIVTLDQAVLSSELASRITAIPYRMGDMFQKGELLVQLDCTLYDAQKRKVSAELQATEIRVNNARQLSQLRSIGTLDLALAEAELQKTQAELDIATLNTQRCQVKAPYSGRIESLKVQEHENVQPHQELLKIIGTTKLEAEILVPADWIQWLEAGHPVQLHTQETDQTISALISHIGPSIDPASQTLQLRARLTSNADTLRPGMSVITSFHNLNNSRQ